MTESYDNNKSVFVILFNNTSFIADTIKWGTHFPYSHAAISLDTTMNNMYSFSNIPYTNALGLPSGNGFTRESIYSPAYVNNIFFDVFEVKVNNSLYKNIYTTIEKLKKSGPVKYPYNIKGLIEYYVLRNIKTLDFDGIYKKTHFFCSEFVAFLINGGKNINLSPGELSELDNVKFIKRFTVDNYKEKDLIKALNTQNTTTKEAFEIPTMTDIRRKLHIFTMDELKEFSFLIDWKELKDSFEKIFGKKHDSVVRFILVEKIIKKIILSYDTPKKIISDSNKSTGMIIKWFKNINAWSMSKNISVNEIIKDDKYINNIIRDFKLA